MTDERPSLVDRVTTWLSGQPFNNVLLVLILCSFGYLAYWTANYAVPSHLRQIQTGYTEIKAADAESQKRVIDTFNRAQDRDYETIRALLKKQNVDLPPFDGTTAVGRK